jgi:hypothetical protein
MLRFIPLHCELIRCADDETTFIEGDSLRRLEPRSNSVVGKFAMCLIENALPSVFGGQLHRYSKTEGIISRARDVTGRVLKSQSGLDKRKTAEKAERTEKAERKRRVTTGKPAPKAKRPKAEKSAGKAKAAKKTSAKKSAAKPAKKSAPKKKGSK